MAGLSRRPLNANEQCLTEDDVPLLRMDELQRPLNDGDESSNAGDEESTWPLPPTINSSGVTGPATEQSGARADSSWITKLEPHTLLPSTIARRWRSSSRASKKARSSPYRPICYFILLAFLILGIVQFISLSFLFLRALFPDQAAYFADHWGDPSRNSKDLLHWPTDFSRDIHPVPCHSHNDYWRKVPTFSAIQAGCSSIEADVWLVEEDLLVGHSESSLTPSRSFANLYIDPLIDILTKQNPANGAIYSPISGERNGVFDTDPAQTLILLIDFKTDGATLWPYVKSQLDPLRQRGFLTHFDGESVAVKPVTAVVTGNAPFSLLIANETYRDIFFDAPLGQMAPLAPADLEHERSLSQSAPIDGFVYNATNSYFASTSFQQSIDRVWADLSTAQLGKLRAQISGAHERGLKARYWQTPAWPRGLRNHIWNVLVREGVDYLNVDDLKAATQGMWGQWD